jgi:hypothetical protein
MKIKGFSSVGLTFATKCSNYFVKSSDFIHPDEYQSKLDTGGAPFISWLLKSLGRKMGDMLLWHSYPKRL